MKFDRLLLNNLTRFPGKSLGYPLRVPKEKISLVLRLTVRFLGGLVSTKVGFDFIPRKTPIILAWCRRHRLYYIDYQHGWRRETACPECRGELMTKKTQHPRGIKAVGK